MAIGKVSPVYALIRIPWIMLWQAAPGKVTETQNMVEKIIKTVEGWLAEMREEISGTMKTRGIQEGESYKNVI